MGPDDIQKLDERTERTETREDEETEQPELLDEVLIEEVGIDGMCGVY